MRSSPSTFPRRSSPDVAYITGTFPIVERKDQPRHGEYGTKRLVLEAYAAAATTTTATAGTPSATVLDPRRPTPPSPTLPPPAPPG